MKTNEDLRRAMGAKGVRQWQVADALGMAEHNFSRKLRKELPQDEKEKILRVISEMEVD